jgi:outer membrane protein assembly factor BamB
MREKTYSTYFLKWVFLLICCNSFSQTEIWRSDIAINDFKSDSIAGSMIISSSSILFDAPNDTLYSIDKKEGRVNWEIAGGKKFKTEPYLYDNTFFYGNNEQGLSRVAQYDLNSGKKIKDLPFISLKTQPYFLNNTMYCTALADGGKLVAYHLEENKVIWQKNIGFGVEAQPVYLKDKIIANAEDDNWFEIDYNGNFLNTKTKKPIYLDTTQFFIKEYKFLTHDGKEITADFLKKNKLYNYEYQTKNSETNTFILTEKQLLVIGNNRKIVLLLNLEKEFAADNFDPDLYTAILDTTPESVWFCYQNLLVHYDFKNKKNLRKADLSKWNPHQILLENRTIWLISKNDGQLYALDFEPNQRMADEIEARARMDFERNRCDVPDQKMIEAAKAAQEKFQIKN